MQTTKMAKDGSKDIIIEYFDPGSKDYKKIINIAKDGEKTVRTTGEHLFKF